MGKETSLGTLIYLHLPKCAGSTVMGVLRANYGSGFYRVPNGGGWRKLHKMADKKRAQITCLTGHMPWGLHQGLSRPIRYAVTLRHPVDRIASLYWFCKRFTRHKFHSAAKHMGLVGFATSGLLADADNGMVRFLSGRRDCGSLKPKQPVTDTDLKLAMTHLRTCAAVGFVSTFKRSIRQMADTFGWASAGYENRMVSKSHRAVMPEERQAIAEYNQFDMALYEYALGVGK